MRPSGPAKLWMGVALGSVLVVGLAAGLAADRLLDGDGREPAGGHGEHGDGRPPSMFHFDCDDRENERATDGVAAGAESTDGDGSQEPGANGADGTPLGERSHARRHHHRRVTGRMAERLELDTEQTEALAVLVDDAMTQGQLYWAGARDEFCAMQRDFHQEIAGLLRPDQIARFDELRRELRQRGHRHGRGSGDRDEGPDTRRRPADDSDQGR